MIWFWVALLTLVALVTYTFCLSSSSLSSSFVCCLLLARDFVHPFHHSTSNGWLLPTIPCAVFIYKTRWDGEKGRETEPNGSDNDKRKSKREGGRQQPSRSGTSRLQRDCQRGRSWVPSYNYLVELLRDVLRRFVVCKLFNLLWSERQQRHKQTFANYFICGLQTASLCDQNAPSTFMFKILYKT